ncbi:MAG TPA: hypothetical protein PKY81_01380 [bacterium]|nr:hypothetical protein [bacterium]HPN29586.1 hypothetical protein [bacterium]
MDNKITEDDIKNIIDNTEILKDNFLQCAIQDYSELFFSVIGKTPFRDDMCISREGSVVISPQLLFTPNKINYNLSELAEDENIVIEARILFFNNYKLQFSEHPVRRYKKSVENVASEIIEDFFKSDNKTWAVIKTPDAKLWRLSLLHYISGKSFYKNRDNNSGNNRISNLL